MQLGTQALIYNLRSNYVCQFSQGQITLYSRTHAGYLSNRRRTLPSLACRIALLGIMLPRQLRHGWIYPWCTGAPLIWNWQSSLVPQLTGELVTGDVTCLHVPSRDNQRQRRRIITGTITCLHATGGPASGWQVIAGAATGTSVARRRDIRLTNNGRRQQ